MEVGSNTLYRIPPPPPPIDAQLGRMPVVHASITTVTHLAARCMMLMKSSVSYAPAGHACGVSLLRDPASMTVLLGKQARCRGYSD